MAIDTLQKLTVEEYLAQERRAETKSEYLDGEVFAMTGASLRHNRLLTNLLVALASQLRSGSCQAVVNDQRVHIPATNSFTYPDLVAYCGEPELLDEEMDTLLNPVLIAEVLSPSTADYDRGGKFAHYRAIPSLREYLVLDQGRVHAEHHRRRDDGSWLLHETDDPAAVLRIEAISCDLRLADVYEGVLPSKK